jgi:phospholipase D1/2
MHIPFDAFFYVKMNKVNSTYDLDTFLATGAENLIPIELAIKIARKIKAKERFAAYIVIPMWPEGNPTTAAMQEILYWQVRSSSWSHFH